ncbi:MAG: Hsp20/alpha crystallin family protein [Candidatus Uhrbacteria bacterium]|nr:Hsp20/alpha crystallin family protein [Candidatus Uhrbacteria bacterium]
MTPSHSPIHEWTSSMEEGQLSVDVFRDKQDLVVRSTVSGAKPEDIDISIHGDLMTIRGKRESQNTAREEDWFYRECYWGAFSRSIVLPYDVKADKAEASMTNGVLEIRIPIRDVGERNIPIRIKE